METTCTDVSEKRARIIRFYTPNSDCVESISALKVGQLSLNEGRVILGGTILLILKLPSVFLTEHYNFLTLFRYEHSRVQKYWGVNYILIKSILTGDLLNWPFWMGRSVRVKMAHVPPHFTNSKSPGFPECMFFSCPVVTIKSDLMRPHSIRLRPGLLGTFAAFPKLWAEVMKRTFS